MADEIGRDQSDSGLAVVGHPLAGIGMGEHVRSVWRGLNEVGGNARIVDIYGPPGPIDPVLQEEFGPTLAPRLSGGINIYCINGDEVRSALDTLRDRNPFLPGSKNVIYPAWELDRYPAEWAEQVALFDEVWAPSAFIRDSIAAAVDIPVVHMPLACEVKTRALRSRQWFGIRESSYAFLFAFDFLSYVERKNPFALIEAFKGLIEKRPHADVVLVVKTNNAAQRPAMKARFDAAVAEIADRLVIIDRTLYDFEMKALVSLCDCFVSLHRSEGFGRGLSEAMALGKPVLATAYSGNMDFCTAETAHLIDFDMVPVGPGQYPHWENQHWANPDVAGATRAMLDLLDNPEQGRAMGRRARAHISREFSYLAAGTRYQERLNAMRLE